MSNLLSNPPLVRKITELMPSDNAERKMNQAELDKTTCPADAKECPKPVWFTAFFDGTGNNHEADGNGSIILDDVQYSNIAKLWSFAHKTKKETPRQSVEYIEGVGTKCDKVHDSGKGTDKIAGMAQAAKGKERIDWMMKQLKLHVDKFMPYVNQINLAVFGFSRGATQARAFVRMLNGSLAEAASDDALVWKKPNAKGVKPKVVVYFMGIFDTVASVGFGGSRLESSVARAGASFATVDTPFQLDAADFADTVYKDIDKKGHADWAKDLRIPRYVTKCVHFVAAHEVREKFPLDSVREDQVTPDNCVEIFYPGCHSDIGGGYSYDFQEHRSNALANIPLAHMFIEAWKAGVPLREPSEVMADAGALFEIPANLIACWDVYMGQHGVRGIDSAPAGSKLEKQIIWHRNRYFNWRASRSRRLTDGTLKPNGGVDPYMAITDKEWQEDLTLTAGVSKAKHPSHSPFNQHDQALYDAYHGTWIEKLGGEVRRAFEEFFDKYVHDSIAGFKNQMSDGYASKAEDSRWSVGRQIFMGKRGENFLYWRYEGVDPENAKTKIALQQQPQAVPIAAQHVTDGALT